MPAKTPKRQISKSLRDEDGIADSSHQGLLQSIKGIAESLHALNRQAVREYPPVVEGILRSRSRDPEHIEHTLDGLLDFCGCESGRVLFMKLCRHYWDLDPSATAWHINAYRERWDTDENAGGKSAPQAPGGGGA